ncbi:MAG TPA: ABC transporter substrate-binding protein [Kofleriaceae bacterium]|nr:ABC transporter substrate-binding protein [Kofleriaceae bacterium]
MHRITAAMIGIAIAVSACAPKTRRTPDDTLVMVIEAAMTTADPRYAITGLDGKLSKLVHPGLTAVDTASLEPQRALAASITRVDDLTWDVTLRPDAKFSDGTPVLARDVAGTYRYILDPKSDSLFHKQFAERFRDVEPTGERSVRFHLITPLATFMTDIDFGIVSFAHGTPAKGKAVGAGPFSVAEITSTHVVLDANPHYYGAKAKLPHVEIRFVRDGSARLLMLVGGSADLIQNAVRLDLVPEIRGRPRVEVTTGPSVFLTYLLLNNTDPHLRDKRVRQAIALAIDRPAVIEAQLGGNARLATGLLPPNHWAYEANVAHWNLDLSRAKRLLDEAGFRDPDGDGPQPRFSLTYKTSSDQFRVSIARVLAAQLSRVGIAVEVRSFEFATFFADVKKGSYQLASMQTTDITEPDFYFTYFHSSWIPSAKNPDGYNRWRYVNPEVDRLTAAGRRELDHDKRKQLYAEVQRIVADDVPIIPLWHEDNIAMTNVDVQGYVLVPNARLTGLRDAWKRRSE